MTDRPDWITQEWLDEQIATPNPGHDFPEWAQISVTALAVEIDALRKALAEQREEWAAQIALERQKLAADPIYAEEAVIFELRRQLAEQEARHRREVIEVRRATLQEAARAVCERCETDAPAYDPECGWWYHTDLIGCDATPIHGLLAALDKEGDHE